MSHVLAMFAGFSFGVMLADTSLFTDGNRAVLLCIGFIALFGAIVINDQR